MKKLIFPVLAVVTLAGCSEKTTSDEGVSNFEVNKRLYERSVELKDVNTSVVALNYMLLEDSTNMEYTDSLARIYMTNGLFETGIQLGLKVMEKQPDNDKLLELIASAQEYEGSDANLIKSYKNFKSLFDKTGDLKYSMKLAQISIVQGNYKSAMDRLDSIIANPETVMMESPTRQGGSQQVDIKAGAYFLKAQYAFQNNQMAQGAQLLNLALQISPNYEAGLELKRQLDQYNQQSAAQGGRQPSQNLTPAQLEKLRYEQWKKQNGQ